MAGRRWFGDTVEVLAFDNWDGLMYRVVCGIGDVIVCTVSQPGVEKDGDLEVHMLREVWRLHS